MTITRSDIYKSLERFPLARQLFPHFKFLQFHPGYSGAEDIHLVDPELPGAITCTPSEAELLAMIVRALRPDNPLEIGSYIGWSTAHLAAASTNRLQCIEPFIYGEDYSGQLRSDLAAGRFRENVIAAALEDRIILVEEPSPACLRSTCPSNGWDFVFLDGWHNNGQPIRDVKGLLPLLRQDVVLVLHDIWIADVRDAMLLLMREGFSAYSLQTANFLTICVRGTLEREKWGSVAVEANSTAHVLKSAARLRPEIGLSEDTIGETCSALEIPNRYHVGMASQ